MNFELQPNGKVRADDGSTVGYVGRCLIVYDASVKKEMSFCVMSSEVVYSMSFFTVSSSWGDGSEVTKADKDRLRKLILDAFLKHPDGKKYSIKVQFKE